MNIFCYVESPIGRLMLTSDGEALTGLYMNLYRNKPMKLPDLGDDWVQNATLDPLPQAIAPVQRIFRRHPARFQFAAAHGKAPPFSSGCGGN